MGRETPFGDNVHENLLKIAFLNKYSMESAGGKGYLQTFIKDTLAPPTGFIDEPLKDLVGMFSEDGEIKGDTLKAIPYGRFIWQHTTAGGAESSHKPQRNAIYDDIRASVRGDVDYNKVRRAINEFNRTAPADMKITAKKIKNIKAKERTKLREK